MGGDVFACEKCGREHFAYHSCNHRACPLCGRATAARWVSQQLEREINAPYFLVTFTLPEELRECFFGEPARQAFNLFFAAVAGALSEKLATAKGFKAVVSGFIAVLHTWTQKLEFHPHIHVLVPAAGIDARGKVVRVRRLDYLVYLKHLQAAFREHFAAQLKAADWKVNPGVWRKTWGVHIQPCGSGRPAIRYLGAYVTRTAIGDKRIVCASRKEVTFKWKDRDDNNKVRLQTLTGTEFVTRYLRHVLPRGLRSIRYYGFCHPKGADNRLRIAMQTGSAVELGAHSSTGLSSPIPLCPSCSEPMRRVRRLPPLYLSRGPPADLSTPEFTFS